MRLHRFYISPTSFDLKQTFWINDERLCNQWLRVLRYKVGDELILFDGVAHERLYKIVQTEARALQVRLITEFERKLPSSHLYLFFSLLKKDKNDWILQKCSELGVRNFVPILAERSEKTGFNIARASRILIEAAEQCGRSDIPEIREPLLLTTALEEYKDKIQLIVADEGMRDNTHFKQTLGLFVGPEGGWTKQEKELFKQHAIGHMHLGSFTLRAETAAVSAIARLVA